MAMLVMPDGDYVGSTFKPCPSGCLKAFKNDMGWWCCNEKKDMIDQPAHYARRQMQAIEYIATNNLEWWEANAVKYMARWDAKDGIQDLYKARSYLDMKIRQLEGHKRFWEKPVSEERKLKRGTET